MTLISQLFFEILEISFQASFLVFLILLVQRIFQLSPQWKYALWFLLLLRLVFPVLPESPYSLFNLKKTLAHFFSVQKESNVLKQLPIPLLSEKQEFYAIEETKKQEVKEDLFQPWQIVSLFWLFVLCLFCFLFVYRFLIIIFKCNNTLKADKDLLKMLGQCQKESGILVPIQLVENSQVKTPCLLGIIRPKIILPKGLAKTLSEEELRYIFLHELTHWKRLDSPILWLTTLLQIVHWFNPLIWLAFSKMRADLEEACDASVLKLLTKKEQKSYGKLIIKLMDSLPFSPYIINSPGIKNGKQQMKARLIMISQFKATTWKNTFKALSIFLLLTVTTLTQEKKEKSLEINRTPLPTETHSKKDSKNTEKETNGKQIPKLANSSTRDSQSNPPLNNEISSGLTLQLTGAKRINRGSRFRYKIKVGNSGLSTNTGVVLTNHLPKEIEFLEASNNGTFDKINHTVQWNLKELSAGKSYQVYITVKATQESPKTGWRNLATVKSNEFSEIKKNFITFVVSIPALHIEMDDLDDPIKIGNSTTYTIVCTNEGQKEATQLHFAFDIPAKGQYISHKASIGGTEIKGTFDSSKNKVVFEALKSLRVGDKAIYEITVKATSAGTANGIGTLRFAEFGKSINIKEPTIYYK